MSHSLKGCVDILDFPFGGNINNKINLNYNIKRY
jgi:hypothetical protein